MNESVGKERSTPPHHRPVIMSGFTLTSYVFGATYRPTEARCGLNQSVLFGTWHESRARKEHGGDTGINPDGVLHERSAGS